MSNDPAAPDDSDRAAPHTGRRRARRSRRSDAAVSPYTPDEPAAPGQPFAFAASIPSEASSEMVDEAVRPSPLRHVRPSLSP